MAVTGNELEPRIRIRSGAGYRARGLVDLSVAFVAIWIDLFMRFEPSTSTDLLMSPVMVPVFCIAAGLCLLNRDSYPIGTFVTVWSLAVACLITTGFRPLAVLLVALFYVAFHSFTAAAIGATGGGFVLVLAQGQASTESAGGLTTSAPVITAIATMGVICVVSGLGRHFGATHRHLDHLLDLHEAERQEAIRQERARIAQDLHDSVAHSLSVMMIQSAGAAATLDCDPERARSALAIVDETGRQGIAELHRMVGLLGDRAQRSPGSPVLPHISAIPGLVSRGSTSNRAITLSVTGRRRDVDPSVDRTGYRIVQECLTNALKHGSRVTPIDVTIAWGASEVTIRVANGLPLTQIECMRHPSGGFGLTGLDERVRAVGGTLAVRSRAHERFVVEASLPLSNTPLNAG